MTDDGWLTPILSGLTPGPQRGLSKERARALDARLQQLRAARHAAEVASRTYVILGAAENR